MMRCCRTFSLRCRERYSRRGAGCCGGRGMYSRRSKGCCMEKPAMPMEYECHCRPKKHEYRDMDYKGCCRQKYGMESYYDDCMEMDED